MAHQHPKNCTCNCHADPESKRMEAVFLQKDDADLRRYFSRAVLVGFDDPRGMRCRDCRQYYGVDQTTNLLRPIAGNRLGPHPDSLSVRFPRVVPLGWRAANWLTPWFAPVWIQEIIRDGVHPPTWEIVTVWKMDD